jgi:hypothetical protein
MRSGGGDADEHVLTGLKWASHCWIMSSIVSLLQTKKKSKETLAKQNVGVTLLDHEFYCQPATTSQKSIQ